MEKTSNFLNEIITNKKSYIANNLEDFNEKKDQVSFGKKGIEVVIEGNYKLDWIGKKRTSRNSGELDNSGILSSFPYTKRENQVIIHPNLLSENFLDDYQKKDHIYLLNPLVFYNPKVLEVPIVVSGTETLPRKRKKKINLRLLLTA